MDHPPNTRVFSLAYFGPEGSGKTTNLRVLSNTPEGEISDSSRAEFFTMSLGTIGKMETRLNIYAIAVLDDLPTHSALVGVHEALGLDTAIPKRVIETIDAIVFVADSGPGHAKANVESMKLLRAERDAYPNDAVLAIQYNKRDLRDAVPLDELSAVLNPDQQMLEFEACASERTGVFDTIKGVTKALLARERTRSS